MIAFLAKAWSLLGGVPWGKVAFYAAIISSLIYEINLIHKSGEQEQTIKQLNSVIETQKKQNDEAVQALRDEYKQDTIALQKERDDAVRIAAKTQAVMDNIKNAKSSDDGPVHPIISNTFNWLREQHTSAGNKNSKSNSTSIPPGPSP